MVTLPVQYNDPLAVASATPTKLPATPLTDPEKFGIRRNSAKPAHSRPSRLESSSSSSYANRPTSLNTPSPSKSATSKGASNANSPKVSSSLSDQGTISGGNKEAHYWLEKRIGQHPFQTDYPIENCHILDQAGQSQRALL